MPYRSDKIQDAHVNAAYRVLTNKKKREYVTRERNAYSEIGRIPPRRILGSHDAHVEAWKQKRLAAGFGSYKDTAPRLNVRYKNDFKSGDYRYIAQHLKPGVPEWQVAQGLAAKNTARKPGRLLPIYLDEDLFGIDPKKLDTRESGINSLRSTLRGQEIAKLEDSLAKRGADFKQLGNGFVVLPRIPRGQEYKEDVSLLSRLGYKVITQRTANRIERGEINQFDRYGRFEDKDPKFSTVKSHEWTDRVMFNNRPEGRPEPLRWDLNWAGETKYRPIQLVSTVEGNNRVTTGFRIRTGTASNSLTLAKDSREWVDAVDMWFDLETVVGRRNRAIYSIGRQFGRNGKATETFISPSDVYFQLTGKLIRSKDPATLASVRKKAKILVARASRRGPKGRLPYNVVELFDAWDSGEGVYLDDALSMLHGEIQSATRGGKGLILAGQNVAGFDIPMLHEAISKLTSTRGTTNRESIKSLGSLINDAPVLDLLDMGRSRTFSTMFEGAGNVLQRTLKHIAGVVGVPYLSEKAHRSGYDAPLSAEVGYKIFDRTTDVYGDVDVKRIFGRTDVTSSRWAKERLQSLRRFKAGTNEILPGTKFDLSLVDKTSREKYGVKSINATIHRGLVKTKFNSVFHGQTSFNPESNKVIAQAIASNPELRAYADELVLYKRTKELRSLFNRAQSVYVKSGMSDMFSAELLADLRKNKRIASGIKVAGLRKDLPRTRWINSINNAMIDLAGLNSYDSRNATAFGIDSEDVANSMRTKVLTNIDDAMIAMEVRIGELTGITDKYVLRNLAHGAFGRALNQSIIDRRISGIKLPNDVQAREDIFNKIGRTLFGNLNQQTYSNLGGTLGEDPYSLIQDYVAQLPGRTKRGGTSLRETTSQALKELDLLPTGYTREAYKGRYAKEAAAAGKDLSEILEPTSTVYAPTLRMEDRQMRLTAKLLGVDVKGMGYDEISEALGRFFGELLRTGGATEEFSAAGTVHDDFIRFLEGGLNKLQNIFPNETFKEFATVFSYTKDDPEALLSSLENIARTSNVGMNTVLSKLGYRSTDWEDIMESASMTKVQGEYSLASKFYQPDNLDSYDEMFNSHYSILDDQRLAEKLKEDTKLEAKLITSLDDQIGNRGIVDDMSLAAPDVSFLSREADRIHPGADRVKSVVNQLTFQLKNQLKGMRGEQAERLQYIMARKDTASDIVTEMFNQGLVSYSVKGKGTEEARQALAGLNNQTLIEGLRSGKYQKYKRYIKWHYNEEGIGKIVDALYEPAVEKHIHPALIDDVQVLAKELEDQFNNLGNPQDIDLGSQEYRMLGEKRIAIRRMTDVISDEGQAVIVTSEDGVTSAQLLTNNGEIKPLVGSMRASALSRMAATKDNLIGVQPAGMNLPGIDISQVAEPDDINTSRTTYAEVMAAENARQSTARLESERIQEQTAQRIASEVAGGDTAGGQTMNKVFDKTLKDQASDMAQGMYQKAKAMPGWMKVAVAGAAAFGALQMGRHFTPMDSPDNRPAMGGAPIGATNMPQALQYMTTPPTMKMAMGETGYNVNMTGMVPGSSSMTEVQDFFKSIAGNMNVNLSDNRNNLSPADLDRILESAI